MITMVANTKHKVCNHTEVNGKDCYRTVEKSRCGVLSREGEGDNMYEDRESDTHGYRSYIDRMMLNGYVAHLKKFLLYRILRMMSTPTSTISSRSKANTLRRCYVDIRQSEMLLRFRVGMATLDDVKYISMFVRWNEEGYSSDRN